MVAAGSVVGLASSNCMQAAIGALVVAPLLVSMISPVETSTRLPSTKFATRQRDAPASIEAAKAEAVLSSGARLKGPQQ